MRRRLGRDRQALLLGPPDQVDRTGGGEVEEVDRRAGQAHQRDVAGDHDLLGGGRHARDAQPARPAPLVHGAPGGQAGVLAVLGQGDPQALGVVEGPAHERPVLHARAVVGEEGHAEGGQLAERGQRGAGAPDGDGARHRDLGRAARAEGEDLRRHPGGVDRRLGVGHGDDGRVAAEGGRPGARLDRLGLLAPGLAQVGVQVDQARADEAAGGVEDERTAGGRRSTRPPPTTRSAGHGDVERGPGPRARRPCRPG